MATYERYSVLTSAKQNLFSASCPVYVHQYQISADRETGKRLLQVRMVNMSRKELQAVYLRVACKDAQEQSLLMMHTVPITGLCAARGAVFGDERVVELWSAQTVCADIFVERVLFVDGSAWNEPEPSDVRRIPAPGAVLPTDPYYFVLQKQAETAGVSNAFAFRSLRECWYCTCGLPNSNYSTQCGHCGASREWLSLHMNAEQFSVPQYIEQAPQKAPEQAPEKAPEPRIPAVVGASTEPVYTPEPIVTTYPQQTEPIYVPEPVQPEEGERDEQFPALLQRTEQPRKKSGGKLVVTLLVIFALLAAGGFFAYKYLMPTLKYKQASDLAAEGKYGEAIALYTELDGFSESEARILACRYNQALELLGKQDYEQAYSAFCELQGYERSDEYAADCLYSQGVLAFNADETDKAWDFVLQLREQYPDYKNTQELADCCCYSFGIQEMNAENYQEAIDWFTEAEAYSDSSEQILACRYELAAALYEQEDYVSAADAFEALDDYADSAQRCLAAMYAYASQNLRVEDNTTVEFLQELIRAEYEDSEALYAGLFSWRLDVFVNTDAADLTTRLTTVDVLSKLVLHYSISGGAPDGRLGILMIYTLPDGKTGNAVLNPGSSQSNTVGTSAWVGLSIPATDAKGTATLKFCDTLDGTELGALTITVTGAP